MKNLLNDQFEKQKRFEALLMKSRRNTVESVYKVQLGCAHPRISRQMRIGWDVAVHMREIYNLKCRVIALAIDTDMKRSLRAANNFWIVAGHVDRPN